MLEQPSKHGRQHHPEGPDPVVLPVQYPIKVFSETQAVVTGDSKFVLEIPFDLDGWFLVWVTSFVSTVSSSGKPTIQVRNITQGHDMLSTKCEIDAGETGSRTAATQFDISIANSDVAAGDLLAIDVDVAGTGAKGLGVYLWFDREQPL